MTLITNYLLIAERVEAFVRLQLFQQIRFPRASCDHQQVSQWLTTEHTTLIFRLHIFPIAENSLLTYFNRRTLMSQLIQRLNS